MDWKSMMLEMNKTNEESWKRILRTINGRSIVNTEKLCRNLIKSKEEVLKQTSKVIKTVKAPVMSKEINKETFKIQMKL